MHDNLKDRLLDALKGCNADYADIRYEENDTLALGYRNENLETATANHIHGGMVRACVRGGWGSFVFSSLDNLKDKVRNACIDAELAAQTATSLADTAIADLVATAAFKEDFRGLSVSAKIALLNEYNQIIRACPGVTASHASYAERFRTVHFASSRGDYTMRQIPLATLRLGAAASRDGQVQNSMESFASPDDFAELRHRQDAAAELAARAVKLLDAPQCPGGRHRVILRPDFAGVFIHEAFGHLSEADFLYENPPMRDLMQLGRHVSVPELTVVDDGSLPGMPGTQPVDDEGTPTGRTVLIDRGILAGHLHSRETAGKMNARPTGNARAISSTAPPIVRMTNTYIEAGPLSREQLFADVDDGIYACGLYGGQTMMEQFTFSAAYAYRIRNGQVGELLRDVVLSGNLFETLHAIDGIANDLTIARKGGGCGKNGQSPLPVTFGGPHIRLHDVLVGGSQPN